MKAVGAANSPVVVVNEVSVSRRVDHSQPQANAVLLDVCREARQLARETTTECERTGGDALNGDCLGPLVMRGWHRLLSVEGGVE